MRAYVKVGIELFRTLENKIKGSFIILFGLRL